MPLPYIKMESLLSFANSFWFWSGPLSWIAAAAWAYFGFSSPFIPGGAPREADKSFLVNQLKRNVKRMKPRLPSIESQGFHKSYPRKLRSQGQFVTNPPPAEQQDIMNEVVDELNRSLNYFNKPVSFVRRPVPLKPVYGCKSTPRPTRTKLNNLKKAPPCHPGHYWNNSKQCFLPKEVTPKKFWKGGNPCPDDEDPNGPILNAIECDTFGDFVR